MTSGAEVCETLRASVTDAAVRWQGTGRNSVEEKPTREELDPRSLAADTTDALQPAKVDRMRNQKAWVLRCEPTFTASRDCERHMTSCRNKRIER